MIYNNIINKINKFHIIFFFILSLYKIYIYIFNKIINFSINFNFQKSIF